MLISDSLGKGTLLPTNDAIPHINNTTHYINYIIFMIVLGLLNA
jgi:hypothetical protein